MSSSPKIAIVGAGPSGLLLARILLMNGIKATVFERDVSRHARSQGGSLDLREDGGQKAMKMAGLFDDWQRLARPSGMDFTCTDKHGTRLLDIRDIDTNRPEIDRHQLRDLLIDSIPEDMIRWGSNLRSVENGNLHFLHGSETGFDLIVGADGAWSKVRPAVHSFVPFYSSVSMWEVHLREVDNKHPPLGKLLGQGSFFAIGGNDGLAILAQRQADQSVKIYATKQTHESWITDGRIDPKKPEEARDKLASDFEDNGWNDQLVDLIRKGDDDLTSRAIYMMPPGLRWRNTPGYTLMGDAAHVMSPFQGEGVNAALWDAMTLAEEMLAHDSISAGVRAYEQKMFVEAKVKCENSWLRLNERFNEGGAETFSGRYRRMLGEAGLLKDRCQLTSISES